MTTQPNARWHRRADLIRRALADVDPVPFTELLVPRDLNGKLARQMQPDPGVTPREAAALLLFFPFEDDLWAPLTVRSGRLPLHRGEVSLPGGQVDPEDAGPAATALREAQEELGIAPDPIEIWGMLTPFYIPPSNFRLTPVVGFMAEPPLLDPNPHEVEAAFTVSLDQLLDPTSIVVEDWKRRGIEMRVPFFALHGYKVWGATAMLLSELVFRLRRLRMDV